MSMQRPTVRNFSHRYGQSTFVCLYVLFAGQASSRREPHTLRQELELSDHGRGYVRPLWPLREHQTDTHRQ